MLLRQLLDKEYAIVRGLRPKAIYQIRLTLSRWADVLGRGPDTTDLTNLRVMEFLALRKTKVSMGTVLKDRNHICGLANYAAKQDRTMPFLTLPPMSPVKRAPRAYTIEDISKVVRVARALPGEILGVPRGLWWSTILRTAFETAERHGALEVLKWGEVDIPGRLITFLAEGRKGARQDIQREISGDLAAWLEAMKKEPDDLVWPWKGAPSTQWLDLHRRPGRESRISRVSEEQRQLSDRRQGRLRRRRTAWALLRSHNATPLCRPLDCQAYRDRH